MAVIPDKIEQIEQMRLGIDYRFTLVVRGFTLSVRPLSIAESVTVATNVAERLSTAPKAALHRLTEHHFLAKETLILASTTDYGTNDPKITELILDRMTPEELSELFKQYVDNCDRCNPSLDLLPPERLGVLIEDLKKNLTGPQELASRLTELSRSHLLSLAHSLLSTKGD